MESGIEEVIIVSGNFFSSQEYIDNYIFVLTL